MHDVELLGRGGDVALQIAVVALLQADELLVRRVVVDEDLEAAPTPAVEEPVDEDLVDLPVPLVVDAVVDLVAPKALQPGQEQLVHLLAAAQGQVHGQVVELREDALGLLVAAEVVVAEVEGDDAGIVRLDQGVGGGLRDVVQAHAPHDDEVDQQREVVGGREQLDALEEQAPAEEGQHGHELGGKQQIDVLARDLILAEVAVDHRAERQQEVGRDQDIEDRVHPVVVLVEHHGPVQALEADAPVEDLLLADRQGRQVHHRAQAQQPHAHPAPERDVAQGEDDQHQKQLQIAAADIAQAVGVEGLAEGVGAGQQHIGEVRDRHEHKDHRDVHVEVPVPQAGVDDRQQHRQEEADVIKGCNHGSFLSPPICAGRISVTRSVFSSAVKRTSHPAKRMA